MQTFPRVTVKNNIVTVRRFNSSTQVSVLGSPSVDIKDMSQRIEAAKEGGLKKAALGGQEYFLEVCDEMREILKDK